MFLSIELTVPPICCILGWIPAYSLDTDVTDSDARAAYLSSIFFFGITAGRLLSVPTAMYVTPTIMMRFLLALVWLGVALFTTATLFQDDTTYAGLVVSCAVLGLGISSIYPVGLTIAQDYGIVMDSRTISICCIGAVTGEAVVPACFGLLMNSFTPVQNRNYAIFRHVHQYCFKSSIFIPKCDFAC